MFKLIKKNDNVINNKYIMMAILLLLIYCVYKLNLNKKDVKIGIIIGDAYKTYETFNQNKNKIN